MKFDKKRLWVSLIILVTMTLVTIVTMVAMVNVASASPETQFFVDPPEVSGSDPFLINVSVTEAPDSYAWEIYLSWDPDLLELVFIEEGDFLHRWEPNPFPPPDNVPKYETTFAYIPLAEANPLGEIMIGCSLIGDVPWASGEGWLVSLGFTVEATGSCVLDLHKTRLWDHIEAGSPASTYYPNQDGFFFNEAFHDIAVTSVTANTTEIAPGESVSINVTVENEGNFSETFDVTVYADVTVYNTTVEWWPDEIIVGDEITVGTETLTDLASGATATSTVTWDTTGVPADTYTISAEAVGDDDTRDNLFIDGTVKFIVLHDLKIAGITVLTPSVLGGELANMSVNVLNQGTSSESFTLYVNASDTTIYTTSDSLDAGADRTYEISWDTTGVAGGDYTISAYVPPVPDEVQTANNLLVDGTVKVQIHDLKIAGIAVLTPSVDQGWRANMSVNVLNEGTETETFDIWVYADIDTAVIGDEIIVYASTRDSLDAGTNRTYDISWDTTVVAAGTYTISAKVTSHPDEVDTADNLLVDGTVEVMAHDIAVTDVVPSPTEVAPGDSVTISVTVRNEGSFNETFDVTVYYDGTIIDTETDVSLEDGASTTLTFTWDTAGVAEDTYAIEAEASVVPGETDTDDNTYPGGTVEVRKAEAPNILIYVAVAAVAIAIIAAVAIYFLKFRK